MKTDFPAQASAVLAEETGEGWSRERGSFPLSCRLAEECLLTVSVNGVPYCEIVCTPADLEEMVLGRLLSDGLIASVDEVERLSLCGDGLHAEVVLNKALPPLPVQTPPAPLRPIPCRREWVLSLAAALEQGLPLYAATQGVHSCLLMREGKLLASREDIGRHNAMDKVFGWALLHGVPLSQCLVFTSGRLPADMVRKVIRAGVPVLASKAMPTRSALALARAFSLTLIGGAHTDGMVFFSPVTAAEAGGEERPKT